ncbi:MAG TPA: EscD/YscD/HrpQ family type III secretion system inner membrane ring protein, partial [Opitutae bacterium]|nr:EscD/YscD/HrpQ family type III secretion system inner membrane ring protein [Opitutae bacterium]
MADSNERYLLKVLSGPHQGAEISLKEGEYLVGSSGDCDVILSDASLAPEHFKITVSASDAKLVSMGEDVYVHGKLAHEDPVVVEPFQFITVGSTQLVLGPSGEAWPAISAADAPELEKEEAVPEGAEGSEPGAEPLPEGAEGEPLLPGEGPAAEPPPPPGLKQKLLGPLATYLEHPFYIAYKFYLWVSTGLVIAILMGLAFFLTYTPPAPPPDLKAVEREVVKTLSQVGFQHDVGVHIVDDQVFVYGYVDTEIQKRKIQIILEPFGSLVAMRIFSEDGIIQSARDVLSQFNLNLRLTLVGPGRLKVEGYVMELDTWRKAQVLMLQDVAGVESIDTNLITGK